jgi:hypothetical protein
MTQPVASAFMRRDTCAPAPVTALLAASACSHERPNGNVIILGTTNRQPTSTPVSGRTKPHRRSIIDLQHTGSISTASCASVPELAESIEHPDPLTYIARLRRACCFTTVAS